MNLWRRLFGTRTELAKDVAAWRDDWARAAAEPHANSGVVESLRSRLPTLSVQDDLEIEHEMLEGLEQAFALTSAIAARGLPAITTGHRVVGSETCHLIAPASMPDDPAQPSGQLLLTSGRAIFVGAGRGLKVAWHTVSRPTQADRDFVLIRVDGSAMYRFRCNSYGDAISAAIIARQLVKR